MDALILCKEIKSESLKEIIKTLNGTVERIQSREIPHKQGMAEITGCKHIIQSIALDWSFNGKIAKDIKKLK